MQVARSQAGDDPKTKMLHWDITWQLKQVTALISQQQHCENSEQCELWVDEAQQIGLQPQTYDRLLSNLKRIIENSAKEGIMWPKSYVPLTLWQYWRAAQMHKSWPVYTKRMPGEVADFMLETCVTPDHIGGILIDGERSPALDRRCDSILHWAVRYGHVAVIDRILDIVSDVEGFNASGKSIWNAKNKTGQSLSDEIRASRRLTLATKTRLLNHAPAMINNPTRIPVIWWVGLLSVTGVVVGLIDLYGRADWAFSLQKLLTQSLYALPGGVSAWMVAWGVLGVVTSLCAVIGAVRWHREKAALPEVSTDQPSSRGCWEFLGCCRRQMPPIIEPQVSASPPIAPQGP